MTTRGKPVEGGHSGNAAGRPKGAATAGRWRSRPFLTAGLYRCPRWRCTDRVKHEQHRLISHGAVPRVCSAYRLTAMFPALPDLGGIRTLLAFTLAVTLLPVHGLAQAVSALP